MLKFSDVNQKQQSRDQTKPADDKSRRFKNTGMTSFVFEFFFLNSLVVRNKVSYLKTNSLCLWVFPKFYPGLFNTAYICFVSKSYYRTIA